MATYSNISQAKPTAVFSQKSHGSSQPLGASLLEHGLTGTNPRLREKSRGGRLFLPLKTKPLGGKKGHRKHELMAPRCQCLSRLQSILLFCLKTCIFLAARAHQAHLQGKQGNVFDPFFSRGIQRFAAMLKTRKR